MPRISDVMWRRVDLRPITHCEPPKGQTCRWEAMSSERDANDCRRHALAHPGHQVIRDVVSRTGYWLPTGDEDSE